MRDYAQSAAATPTTLGDLMKEQMSGDAPAGDAPAADASADDAPAPE